MECDEKTKGYVQSSMEMSYRKIGQLALSTWKNLAEIFTK